MTHPLDHKSSLRKLPFPACTEEALTRLHAQCVTFAGKPNVKLVANMHGNEAVGREMLLHFILHLVRNYESDYFIRWLLDNTRIHVMPSMNPDGFEVAAEGTCQGGQGR